MSLIAQIIAKNRNLTGKMDTIRCTDAIFARTVGETCLALLSFMYFRCEWFRRTKDALMNFSSVGSTFASQPQGCELESRSSHFLFLLLTREIYENASEHSRSRGFPFTR